MKTLIEQRRQDLVIAVSKMNVGDVLNINILLATTLEYSLEYLLQLVVELMKQNNFYFDGEKVNNHHFKLIRVFSDSASFEEILNTFKKK